MGKTVNAISCLLVALSLFQRSDGQGFSIPESPDNVTYTPTPEDNTNCTNQITTFGSYFTPATTPVICQLPTSDTVSDADWAIFKKGFDTALADDAASPLAFGYDLRENFVACKQFNLTSGGNRPELGTPVQKAMCNFLNAVALSGSFCEKLTCNLEEFNKLPTVEESKNCYGIGKKMCEAVYTAGDAVFRNAIVGAIDYFPSALNYVAEDVPATAYQCNIADCDRSLAATMAPTTSTTTMAPTTSTTTMAPTAPTSAGGSSSLVPGGSSTPTSPSGAMRTSLVAAALIGGASVLL